ncbi:sodium:solute symporter family protein [Edaphobacter modestus]|uniref:SSS family solute:Na+ symporter n=1 Tax=Edaphobacter modestus TaxID=388466 RepID=A0A4Q7YRY4_9BACT|nr:sodium:solute symporter family protein [Edaphobacter modestus]RZU39711.1 SSS family solute:Na+ symporter [Edaphobacter modestus]
MKILDWLVLCIYFLVMLGMGFWARAKVKTASDFFTAGGVMPWWLSGISHHMSGYSSAVFVAYAAIAYTAGFSIYIWWACSIGIALIIGSNVFPGRWSRLRQRLDIISPLEYLAVRYNLPAQQILAWCGALLKIFDVGAKWTAAAILLQVFAHVPTLWGVLLTGSVTLIYSVVGGLWADALTDMSQFIIQVLAGIVMLVAVLTRLGGISGLWTIWGRLPASHSRPFVGQYTLAFAIVYLLVNFLSYNGGTWNLAQRFIAAPTATAARKAALLSASLYLVWPLVLFYPMWASPLLLPHLADPSQSYALLTKTLLPQGLIGLVLAGMFAHTMAMTSSDANAISAVVVRDILPALRKGQRPSDRIQLLSGRICTLLFLSLSMFIALSADHFGGVIGLVILWYGALLGPIAIPMLFGMLNLFRRSGANAAIASWAVGAIAFGLIKFVFPAQIARLPGDLTTTITIAGPVLSSLVVFIGVGLIWPMKEPAADRLLKLINDEDASATAQASHHTIA